MKIRELNQREPYEDTLRANVRLLLSTQERNVLVTAPGADAAQIWFRHLLYDVYVPQGFDPRGRAWLSRLYGYAPRRERRIPQWLICQISRLAPTDRVFLRPAFGTTVDFGHASMIMAGNQRFRLYHFDHNRVITTTKQGFSPDGLAREIALRQRPDNPDFIRPCETLETGVMEEELLDALPLNRLWDNVLREQAEHGLCRILEQLRGMDAARLTGAECALKYQKAFEAAWQKLSERFFGISRKQIDVLFKKATARIQTQEYVSLCRSHGDLQPGNVLIDRDGRMTVIDWEDTAIRASAYDAMVYALRSRFPQGLGERIETFLKSDAPLSPLLSSLGLDRPTLVALWFCEDCLWQLEVSAREGICHIPDCLTHFFLEAAQYLERTTRPL